MKTEAGTDARQLSVTARPCRLKRRQRLRERNGSRGQDATGGRRVGCAELALPVEEQDFHWSNKSCARQHAAGHAI